MFGSIVTIGLGKIRAKADITAIVMAYILSTHYSVLHSC